MANAREFVTLWGFKIEHEKLDKVEQQLEAIKHRLEFLAAAEVAHKLFELTERFAKFAEELNIAAESAGLAVEDLQKLGFAAGHAAVSQEELNTSLARIARSLYAARTGSEEAQKAFAQAGFTPEQVSGFKNSKEALLGLADRLRAIPDPIARVALAQELLGRGSQKMVGFLAQGSAAIRKQGVEAEELGVILSKGQVEALVKVEHALNNFWLLMKNIGATIAAQVAPSLEFLIGKFLEFFKANRQIIELNFSNWVYSVTFALGFLFGIVTDVTNAMIKLAKYFHLEGEILPTIATIASFVLGLYAVVQVFNAIQNVLRPTIALINLMRNSWIATAIAEWLAEAPLLAIVGAIAILLIVVDQLWALLTGQPSWLAQFVNWLKTISSIHDIISAVSEIWDKLVSSFDGVGTFFSKIPGYLSNLPTGLLGTLGIGGAPGAGVPVPGSIAGNQTSSSASYDVNAPININIAGGANATDVGKQAREGVKDHLNRVFRETQRSTTSAVAY